MLFLPTSLTSDSLNLTARPSLVANTICLFPSVISTPINLSSSLRFIAIIPPCLGFEYSDNFVFLIIPFLVAINKNPLSKLSTETIAAIFSSLSNFTKLTIAVPLAYLPDSGT